MCSYSCTNFCLYYNLPTAIYSGIAMQGGYWFSTSTIPTNSFHYPTNFTAPACMLDT